MNKFDFLAYQVLSLSLTHKHLRQFLKKDLIFFSEIGLGFKQRRSTEGLSGQREAKGSAERQSNHCNGRSCLSLIWL